MKTARFLAIPVIAAFLTGAPANDVAAASESNPTTALAAPTPPTTAPTSKPLAASTSAQAAAARSPIDRIRAAPDPSSTVDAYTHAIAADPGNLELEKAYVHRMVELNAPEMADAQARDVVARDRSDWRRTGRRRLHGRDARPVRPGGAGAETRRPPGAQRRVRHAHRGPSGGLVRHPGRSIETGSA